MGPIGRSYSKVKQEVMPIGGSMWGLAMLCVFDRFTWQIADSLKNKNSTMKIIVSYILTFITISCQAQTAPKFNLGFEKQSNINSLSDGWFKWGNYTLTIDTLSNTGQKSGKITSSEDGQFGCIAYKIPAKYIGKTIELQGYMKIKNVNNGFAGLMLRVDGNGSPLVFDNMQNQNISGTKDWQQYSIKLNYPQEAENIFVAGILTGKGEAWFDGFELKIDGENVQSLKEIEKKVYKASLDKEFDNGSNIEILDLTPETIDNLELLGRIWGFLKYHHPEIAKGNYNWDYELFRILPKYMNESNATKREELLHFWINGLGEIDKCKTCDTISKEAFLNPDFNWISNYIVSDALKQQLQFIYKNRNKAEHFYVKMAPGVGNPVFENENAYKNMPYPDAGFRLLALYRYWNIINYFYPNKYLTDKDWNNTLKEYITKFINAKNELEYEQAVIQIIGDIQDTHANLWGGNNQIEEWKGNYFAPVHLRFVENKLVVTDYYNPELKPETGLEIGDVITKLDGKSTNDDIVPDLSKYYPSSNEATRLRDISADMLRSQKNELEVEYLRNGTHFTKKVKLYPRNELNIYQWYRKKDEKCYRLMENNIGYVTLMSIKDDDIPKIKEEFKNTKGIIIDLRNYPSTFVPFKLGSFFISSATPFVKFTIGNINNPGEFTFTKALEIPKTEESYKGKLIVLVNELSQSQAEYTAMAFRAGDNTTIIGSTTAGADGNVSTIILPGGLSTMISGIGVYYPNGGVTQRIGIVPDIEVKPTINGIKNGKDELIEKAIEIILNEHRPADTRHQKSSGQ
jgi:C-terminal processing protease CtpA/Prc